LNARRFGGKDGAVDQIEELLEPSGQELGAEDLDHEFDLGPDAGGGTSRLKLSETPKDAPANRLLPGLKGKLARFDDHANQSIQSSWHFAV